MYVQDLSISAAYILHVLLTCWDSGVRQMGCPIAFQAKSAYVDCHECVVLSCVQWLKCSAP